jgi:hypothetical protein
MKCYFMESQTLMAGKCIFFWHANRLQACVTPHATGSHILWWHGMPHATDYINTCGSLLVACWFNASKGHFSRLLIGYFLLVKVVKTIINN